MVGILLVFSQLTKNCWYYYDLIGSVWSANGKKVFEMAIRRVYAFRRKGTGDLMSKSISLRTDVDTQIVWKVYSGLREPAKEFSA